MNWFKIAQIAFRIAKDLAGNTPIGAVIYLAEKIVGAYGSGFNNDNTLEVIKSIGKSRWNNLTPEKIEQINKILKEE